MSTRRHSRLASSVGVVVVAVLVALCSTLLDRPVTRLVAHEGARFLGADGASVRLTDPSQPGPSVTMEWARAESTVILASGPDLFGQWLPRSGIAALNLAYARLTTSGDGPEGSRSDTLLSIRTDGVRTDAYQPRGGTGVIYVPGKLTLPADLRPGLTWTSEGQSSRWLGETFDTPVPYEVQHFAATPSDQALAAQGCLEVTERESSAGTDAAITVSTWCPGAGIVALDDGQRTLRRQASSGLPGELTAPGFDWATSDRLRWHTAQVSYIGLSLVSMSPVAAPGVLADGTLVYANRVGTDVVAVQPGRAGEPSVWRARPGGEIMTAATLGTTTVAVTSRRRAVAYGPDGLSLWTADLSDIARVPPQRFAGGVLITSIDGSVVLFDADGTLRWRFEASSELRVAPVVAGDVVVVADESGEYTCLGADGAVVWTAQHTKADAMAVAGGNLVVLPHAGSQVSAYALADGRTAWQLRPDAALDEIVGVGDLLVGRTGDEVKGYDASTGSLRWRRPALAEQIVAGEGRLLIVGDLDLLVVDPMTGRDLATVPLGLGQLSRTAFFVASGPGRLVVTTGNKAAVGSLS